MFTALADRVVQVVMALAVPPALTVHAQPCPRDVTAVLVSSLLLPCPTMGPTELGPHPSPSSSPVRCPVLRVP